MFQSFFWCFSNLTIESWTIFFSWKFLVCRSLYLFQFVQSSETYTFLKKFVEIEVMIDQEFDIWHLELQDLIIPINIVLRKDIEIERPCFVVSLLAIKLECANSPLESIHFLAIVLYLLIPIFYHIIVMPFVFYSDCQSFMSIQLSFVKDLPENSVSKEIKSELRMDSFTRGSISWKLSQVMSINLYLLNN